MTKRYKSITYVGTVQGALESAVSEIESLRDEMSEWRDNLDNGGLSGTSKFEQVSEAADALSEVYDYIEDIDLTEFGAEFPDQSVNYVEMKPHGKKSAPRWMRLANAQEMLSAVSGLIDGLPDSDDEEGRDKEYTLAKIESASSLADSTSFPGMY